MKRSFFIILAIAVLLPLHADSYRDALSRYLKNGETTASMQQYEQQLNNLLQQAFPEKTDQVMQVLSRYASSQMMDDLTDIYEPAFRKHVSEEELQQLADIYSNPRFKDLQGKMQNALVGLEQSAEYKDFAESISTAISDIVNGFKPKAIKAKGVTKEYEETFKNYYKASKTGEIINRTFAGIAGPMTMQLRASGVANAEQVVAKLMNYISENIPTVLMQIFHKDVSLSDLQMLIDASYSPAYQHSMDAVAETVANPIVLGAQLISKMSAWVDINAPDYSKSFKSIAKGVNAAADPYTGEVYMACDKQPEFPGGTQMMYQYIAQNVVYPEEAAQQGAQGKAIVQVVVNKDGSLSNIEVIRSSGDMALDAEAKRVVGSMPKWTPGVLQDEIVRCKYTIPVNFRLTEPEPEKK